MNVTFHLEWKDLDLLWIISPASLAVYGLEVLRRQLGLGWDRDPRSMFAPQDLCGYLRAVMDGQWGPLEAPHRSPSRLANTRPKESAYFTRTWAIYTALAPTAREFTKIPSGSHRPPILSFLFLLQ